MTVLLGNNFLKNRKKDFVLVYSGHGSQQVGMGRELIFASTVFRESIELCDRLLQKYQNWSVLKTLLEPPDTDIDWMRPEIGARLIFAIQIALTELLREQKTSIVATLGHSVGSIAAAYVAGAFSLEEAVRVLVCYTEILGNNAAILGGMLVVKLSEKRLSAYIEDNDNIFLAGVIDEEFCVVAGPNTLLDELQHKLDDNKIYAAFIRVNVMAHSPHFQIIHEDLMKSFGQIKINATQVPYFCSYTMSQLDGGQLNAVYWADNLCKKFNFHRAIKCAIGQGYTNFIEVSPSPSLIRAITNNLNDVPGAVALSSLDVANGSQVVFVSNCHKQQNNILFGCDGEFYSRKTSGEGLDNSSSKSIYQEEKEDEVSDGLFGDFARLSDYEKKIRLRKILGNELRSILSLDAQFELKDDQTLADIGITSLLGLKLQSRLQKIVNKYIPATFFFSCPTVGTLYEFLYDILISKSEKRKVSNKSLVSKGAEEEIPQELSGLDIKNNNTSYDELLKTVNNLEEQLKLSRIREKELSDRLERFDEPIAIIGMSCRFPGGKNVEEFWESLCNGRDCISVIDRSRWDIDFYYSEDSAAVGKMSTKWAGLIDDIDKFDPGFFEMSEKEAENTDPQHRLFLKVSYEAIEDSRYTLQELKNTSTGVFAGFVSGDYGTITKGGAGFEHISAEELVGNEYSFLAGRLAYWLGVHGPCLVVSTACSSGLVSVHQACASLQNGDCSMAIAGSVNVILSPYLHIASSKLASQAKDGRCKTFDARADGYVRGEGCGVFILKRLSDALKDNDFIHAVIYGSAVNHGGKAISLTAPNPKAQARVMAQALAKAKLSPCQVGYLETHGTGTELGDAIEMEAIHNVYGKRSADKKIVLGAVKTNIGHLEAASGMAGLLKTVLVLKYGRVPPNLNFEALNPQLTFDEDKFLLPHKIIYLPSGYERDVYGAVSSFGLSGINAHVVLGNSKTIKPDNICRNCRQEKKRAESRYEHGTKPYVVAVSSTNHKTLIENCKNYYKFVQESDPEKMVDIAYSTLTTRSHFSHRFAFAAKNKQESLAYLQNSALQGSVISVRNRDILFVFSGAKESYLEEIDELFMHEKIFRENVQEFSEIVQKILSISLTDVLYGRPSEKLLNNLEIIYTTTFVVEYSVAKLLESWGIRPSIILGFGIGEYSAACFSGVVTKEEAVQMVINHARVIKKLPIRKALIVSSEDSSILPSLLSDEVFISAYISSSSNVISVSEDHFELFKENLSTCRIGYSELDDVKTMCSPSSQLATDEFKKIGRNIVFKTPCIPYLSSITGKLVGKISLGDNYFDNQLISPIKFSCAMETLLDFSSDYFIFALGNSHFVDQIEKQYVGSNSFDLRMYRLFSRSYDKTDAANSFVSNIANYWMDGGQVDWQAYYSNVEKNKVSLPHNILDEKRYWSEFVNFNRTKEHE